MTPRFAVDNWAAWAPGLHDQEAWRAWLADPRQLPAEGVPSLTEVAAMTRRRIARLGRVALQATLWCEAERDPCPVVFASRYGDIGLSVDMLSRLAAGAPISPVDFSVSVHNAIGALHSIARGRTEGYTAIAAGEETVEAAFTEALGLLADGDPAAMVVYYDEPLPAQYRGFGDDIEFPRSWACRLRVAEEDGIALESSRATGPIPPGRLPADLAALDFLVGTSETLEREAGPRRWCWRRHV